MNTVIKYPRAKPYFSNEAKEKAVLYLKEILETGNLVQGKYVKDFETRFAAFIGTRYAVATNSCTSALEIVIKSASIKNKKILVPSQTFVATGNSVISSGNIPVFIDMNEDTLCMSLKSIQKNMSKDVAAIILVHIGGLITPEYYDIKSFCDKHNILIIEDSAHAIGSSIDNQKAGSLGIAGCFSFYPTKIMTTGEGGMITTDSKELADLCRLYRNHGGDGQNFYYSSSNYRMTEVNACIGLTQMDELNSFIENRNRIASTYSRLLADVKKIKMLPTYNNIFNCYWNIYFVLESTVNRSIFVSKLLESGIQTGDAYSPPCHKQEVFKKYISSCQDFSVTNDILQRHISLPMYVELKEDEIKFIVTKIKEALK